MNRETTEAAFKVSMWIVVSAGLLLFVVRPGTASYYINLLALASGLVLMGVIALIVRRYGRKNGK